MTGDDEKVMLSVRVSKATRDALERRARRDGTSLSAQVNIALTRFVRRIEEKEGSKND